jgi:hypothetical protein
MPTPIRPGQFYLARFTKNELLVRIEEVAPQGGWIARVLSHGRKVKIKAVSQIIHACDENGIALVADETIPNRRSTALPPVACTNNVNCAKELPKPPAIEHPVPCPMPNQPTEQFTLLDATAMILRERRKPMTTRELVDAIVAERLWTPSGKTPWLTLHSALTRDMESKGSRSRFAKSQERGKFTLRK